MTEPKCPIDERPFPCGAHNVADIWGHEVESLRAALREAEGQRRSVEQSGARLSGMLMRSAEETTHWRGRAEALAGAIGLFLDGSLLENGLRLVLEAQAGRALATDESTTGEPRRDDSHGLLSGCRHDGGYCAVAEHGRAEALEAALREILDTPQEAAWEIASGALTGEPRKHPANCGECGGSGMLDSGGFTPWDAPINVPCPGPRGPVAEPEREGAE